VIEGIYAYNVEKCKYCSRIVSIYKKSRKNKEVLRKVISESEYVP
jgi:hypothetical protein